MLTKLTIVNAKDSLFQIRKKIRSIVESAGEGLGYTSAYVAVLAYFGGRIAVVWRKSHEVAMPSAHPDIFTVRAVQIANSKCSSSTTLWQFTVAQPLSYCSNIPDTKYLVSSPDMNRDNNLVSAH